MSARTNLSVPVTIVVVATLSATPTAGAAGGPPGGVGATAGTRAAHVAVALEPRSDSQIRVYPQTSLSRSGCGRASTQAVHDGKPIVVVLKPYPKRIVVGRIPASWWHRPPSSDPSWQLLLRGFAWVMPLAQRAAQDHQYAALQALANQVIVFQKQQPDRGTSADGWDEGTAMRRLETLNCLYALTGWSSLAPSMRSTVAVELGPRYDGPPYAPVHNHGTMANLRVLEAGIFLNVSRWRSIAIRRLTYESALEFTPKGVTLEQSSGYQALNVSLWSGAARAIGHLLPKSPVPGRIRAYVARATTALSWMTEPDGNLVKIGDTDNQRGVPNPRGRGTFFRDDISGWVVGRWSWRDPLTTYYTLRYGPPRWGHGQQDRPGVTFSTLGVRVLVGPGAYTYDNKSAFNAYQISPQAHNVSYAGGRLYDSRVNVTSASVGSVIQSVRTRDTLFGHHVHLRQVDVSGPAHAMRIYDHYDRGVAPAQALHLDPGWIFVKRSPHQLVFRGWRGRILTITTNATSFRLVRGSTSPVQGWQFARKGARTPNYAILLSSVYREVATVLAVR